MQSVIEQECQPNARPGKLGFNHLIRLALVLRSDHGGIYAPQSLAGSRLGQQGQTAGLQTTTK